MTRSVAPPRLAAVAPVELLDYDVRPGSGGVRGPVRDLLLLHGLGEDKTSMRPLGDRLCPVGSVAVYPSLRGHGASPAPPWGYSPWDAVADLQRVADALPAELHVIGFSYGALVAAATAVALGPATVRSLVLLDQSFEARPELAEAGQWRELVFLKWWHDYRHLLRAVDALGIPVLHVLARDSHVVPPAERARVVAARATHSAVRVVDTDHGGLLREPARLAALCREFYRRTGC